jgi:cold shock CspA family protein
VITSTSLDQNGDKVKGARVEFAITQGDKGPQAANIVPL